MKLQMKMENISETKVLFSFNLRDLVFDVRESNNVLPIPEMQYSGNTLKFCQVEREPDGSFATKLHVLTNMSYHSELRDFLDLNTDRINKLVIFKRTNFISEQSYQCVSAKIIKLEKQLKQRLGKVEGAIAEYIKKELTTKMYVTKISEVCNNCDEKAYDDLQQNTGFHHKSSHYPIIGFKILSTESEKILPLQADLIIFYNGDIEINIEEHYSANIAARVKNGITKIICDLPKYDIKNIADEIMKISKIYLEIINK